MHLAVQHFAGMLPRLAAHLLQPNQAQVARNTRLESGDLQPWHGLRPVQSLQRLGAQAIFLFADQYWFEWDVPVSAVRGPIPEADGSRIYFTGTDKPRFTDAMQAIAGGGPYPANSYQLGLPAPTGSPTVIRQGQITNDDPALVETRAYVYTFVSKYGEESAPSYPSGLINWAPGQTVTVSGFIVPTGDFVIDAIRIYRTASTGAVTIYQFVAQIAATAVQYADNVDTDHLGEELPSENWFPPPADMHSLVALPNGILAGASGLDICISEQYLPHAWPDLYQHTANDPVVALGVIGNSLVVLTERTPYVVTGATPATMTMTQVGPADFACVAPRGAASVPGVGVVYPTANGLAGVTEAGTTSLTHAYMTREQWQAYNPATMIGLAHRGRYFAFHDTGCLVYDPAEDGVYELDRTIRGGYRDPETDTLYLIVDGQIQEWNGANSAAADYVWRSKTFELPYPAAFSMARVRAAGYDDLHLRLIADGSMVANVPVTTPLFRLPVTSRARNWEMELTGSERVHTAAVAETVDEL